MEKSPLNIFHPLISKWFHQRLGSPTDIQKKAWPEISSKKNVLVTAPTGSGKTLTAFLWAIDQLLTGKMPGGQVRILYISPLKALNNDVYKNLTDPLEELQALFNVKEEPYSPIRVLTRSGDTPQKERRQMLKIPPEILITTPESMNILISSIHGRKIFSGVSTVIMDEIHAVVGNKRGTHLMTAVDRLIPLCGEFQRIALSATVKPPDAVAEFIGGYRNRGSAVDPFYEKRPVTIIRSDYPKKLEVNIKFPEKAAQNMIDDSRWPILMKAFKKIIQNNVSTLLFANSRRLTEKVTRMINEDESEILAYSHHGSLSREIRLAVEKRLKNGLLKAIVSTNSLELGIDIGALDQVVLIQTPFSISSAIQRIGRSGHRVGKKSRGALFPTHGRDFLNAAVLAQMVVAQDIEEIKPVDCPLDVLAQIILAMTGVEIWDIDELYAFLKTNASYHHLSRKQFDMVLEMLAGRYADTRLRELKPKISLDRIDNTVKAKSGTLMMVYMAGGTIPDRGYYNMRIENTNAKIGELDEEFVWERRVGESFSLGNQTWRIQKITHNDIEVIPIKSAPGIIPFWKAEARNRDFHFSEKIGLFLEKANALLDKDLNSLKKHLKIDCFMEQPAMEELISFLQLQKTISNADLPHRHHLLVEHFSDPLNRSDSKQVILHTVWGGRVNRPFSMALAEAWEQEFHYPLEVFADDDCILLILPHRFETDDLLRLVSSENIESLLRRRLEKTGFFGARFRENAGRALLLPKTGFKNRMPLWMNRLRAKKLMESIIGATDFPILLETWRTCLKDEFDLENLKLLLDELKNGHINISRTMTTRESPFAKNLIFSQTNKHMYADDTPESGKTSRLTEELIREINSSSRVFSGISDHLIGMLEGKLQRTSAGYSPSSSDELLDWLKDRLLIPLNDFNTLLTCMYKDHNIKPENILKPIKHKLLKIIFPNAPCPLICAIENLPRVTRAFDISRTDLSISAVFWSTVSGSTASGKMGKKIKDTLNRFFFDTEPETDNGDADTQTSKAYFIGQFLSFFGPVDDIFLTRIFGFSEDDTAEIIHTLTNEDQVVHAIIREDTENVEICDRENLEILLRMARKARQPEFTPLPVKDFPLFLAAYQGIAEKGDCLEDLQERLDQLFGYGATAASWEEFIFPARLKPYHLSWLNSLMQVSDLSWFGVGEKTISFAFQEDLPVFRPEPVNGTEAADDVKKLLPNPYGRFSFFHMTDFSGLPSDKTSKKIWSLIWRGYLSSDTYEVLRKGIENKFNPFKAEDHAGYMKGRRRGRFNRWKSTRPLSGQFYLIHDDKQEAADIIEEEEYRKERVRQLLRRYGILFREMLSKELTVFKWGALFKTLRLMELSGEILSGFFFDGISGPQFISHDAFRVLQKELPEDAVYWMNATDPASLSGILPNITNAPLPARRRTTFLVFHGSTLVMVSRKKCKHIHLFVPPDHPHLLRYFSFFKDLLNRQFNPMRAIFIETINDEKSTDSGYLKHFVEFGFTKYHNDLELRKQF